MCEGRVIAPPVLLRCVCALQAAGPGSSCSGSSTERSSAPGAGMTMYENGSDLLSPFPRLADGSQAESGAPGQRRQRRLTDWHRRGPEAQAGD